MAGQKASNNGLTPMQERFCHEYLIDFNATKAATRAGYSAKTAQEQGGRLLSHVRIISYLQKLKINSIDRNKEADLTVERIEQELMRIAFIPISEIVNIGSNNVTLKSESQMSESAIATIEEISFSQNKFGAVIKVKRASKMAALEALAKRLNYYNDKGSISEEVINIVGTDS